MHHMARRQADNDEAPAKDAALAPTPRSTPTVMWIGEGPVCVNIIDMPAPCAHDGVCRCGGCHASLPADFAWKFY